MAGPSIIARLGLDSDGFKRGLDSARQSVAGLAGALGVGLSVGAAAAFAGKMMDLAGNLQDMSDRLGVGVVALQELEHAFGQGGASVEDLDKAIMKLGENSITALEGNQKMIASFERLGVSLDELNSMSRDEIIMEIAKSAEDAQDPAQRLADILDVLGKSGAKMAPLLNAGKDAIDGIRKSATTLSKEDIALLDDAGDMWANIWKKVEITSAKGLLSIRKHFGGSGAGALRHANTMWGEDPARPSTQEDEAAEAERLSRVKEAAKRREQAEQQAQQESFERMQEQYVKHIDGEIKSIHEQAIKDRATFEETTHAAMLEHKRKQEESYLKQADEMYEAFEKDREKKKNQQERQDEIRDNARELDRREGEAFVQAELAGPDARREARRAERERERALNKFGRLRDLKARGGMSKADFEENNFAPFERRGGAADGINPAAPGPQDAKISEVVTEIKDLKAAVTGLKFVTPPGRANK